MYCIDWDEDEDPFDILGTENDDEYARLEVV